MRTEDRYRILILLAIRSEQHVSCECVWRDAVTAAAWFKDSASDREWKRMAATSMRMPGKHQAPLKTLNRGNNFYRAHRAANTAKRKSAVELLQETKAFYVKSETVLDRKQELKNSGHLQVTSSAVDTVFLRGPLLKKSASGPTAWLNHVHGNPGSRPEQDKYVHQHVLVLSTPQAPPAVPPRANPLQPSSQQTPPPLPPKSPRLIPAAQRRSGSNPNGDQLQTKLRRLLNADSKENLYQRLLDNDDQDVKTVAGDEKPYAACHQYGRSISHIQHGPPPPPTCKVHHKSLPDLHSSPTRIAVKFSGDTSSNTSSSSSTSSSSTSTSSSGRCRRSVGSAPGTTLSSASHRSQPNLSSPRVGTMRCFTRLSSGGSSPVRELENDVHPNSTSSYSDSGAEDANSSACRDDDTWHRERRRPILRSKSDISHRYSVAPKPSPVPQPRSAAQLDKFFEQLGLEAGDFRSLSAPASGSSSPVFFESVSSVDSGTNPWVGAGGGSGGSSNFHRSSEQLSIVERNARIIKWLCNCRKAHLASRKSS